jgi:Protein of unknown function (DUF3619)
MNEAQFAHRVRHELNLGARVDARVATQLRAARERALARQGLAPEAGVALGGAGVARRGGLHALSLRVLLPVLILGVAFAATYAWQQRQRAAEVEELDALLLSSDLPIDAYLDQGFAAWLKRRASQ